MASPLFVSRFGHGAPLLCLHGIEAHGLRFVGLASHLDGVELVAPDLRGHGRSPRDGPFSLDQHVRDLLPILGDLGPQTTLVGHSYGGLIAWEVARAAPSAVARLVLVDPPLEVDPTFARQGLESAAMRFRWTDRDAAFRDLSAGRQRAAHWSVALDVAVGLDESGAGPAATCRHRRSRQGVLGSGDPTTQREFVSRADAATGGWTRERSFPYAVSGW
jgi:lipase